MVAAQVARAEPSRSGMPAALRYAELGWSIIPVDGTSKQPLVPWRYFIDRRPSIEQIQSWAARYRNAGIAVITGPVSQLVVLDADGAEGVAEAERLGIPKTPTARTPRGGAHYYFLLPADLPTVFKNAVKLGESKKLDVRGHAGYVVAPYTRRSDGKRYEWVLAPENVELASPPEWFLNMLRTNARYPAAQASRPIRGSLVSHPDAQQVSSEADSLIEKLPGYIQTMVREGHDLTRFKSKSECDFAVIVAMVAAGADEALIEEIYSNFPIGEKFQDPKYGPYYLNRTIEQALGRVRIVRVKFADPIAYEEARSVGMPPGARVHLALIIEDATDAGRMIRCGLTMPDPSRSAGLAARWRRFFEAAGMAVPTTYEETRMACKRLIGKRLRVELGGDRHAQNPISAFYCV